ncbi:cytochrome [Oleiphilus messinensis]|uniref:nitrite reductase (cytochrome; ammonia-forming) n=2 Tax=Oleiphilus messinensis TaxID=141451 RepID=A0A1Y0I6J7_9GAMM|nr:cytochrome [Oleiphilus messinensis]
MKKTIWLVWGLLSLALASYYGYQLLMPGDKSEFLIGDASHGHFQIELDCESCHTSPFGGQEVLQDACVNCHGAELEAVNDSHPKNKFTDPRNADRVEILDARYCVTCHVEHQEERTHEMGVTVPEDFCFRCHQDIGSDRPSHEGLTFDTCASAGCHNYHDNLALYEAFLVKHAEGAETDLMATMLERTFATEYQEKHKPESLTIADLNPADLKQASADVLQHWQDSGHAEAGVTCSGCHQGEQNSESWIAQPGLAQCSECHTSEVQDFVASRHGMRLNPDMAMKMSPMSPGMGRLEFKPDALSSVQGCAACHQPHQYQTQPAMAEACVGCHDDEHTNNFAQSPHGQLWQKVKEGALPEERGVACSTCHMPREHVQINGKDVVRVQHNPNHNLRPNEKMIRSSCMNCHSLAFSIDALADPDLIRSNFSGKPAKHIESIDMALSRVKEKN